MNNLKFTSVTLNKMKDISSEVLNIVKKSNIKNIILNGNLGSGKTTFTANFLSHCGVKEAVKSPTFNIVQIYKNTKLQTVNHFDLYRIKNFQELEEIGIYDYINNDFCIFEWPEILTQNIKLDNCLTINLMYKNIKSRDLEVIF